MYYVLFYELVDNYITLRQPLRPEHLQLVQQAHERGEVVMGGALDNPPDKALLIFHVEDPAIIERFVQQDPYVQHGLVKRWEIRPWNVVVGQQPKHGR